MIIEDELKMVANALTKLASVGTLESFIHDGFDASLDRLDGLEEFIRALAVVKFTAVPLVSLYPLISQSIG